MERLPVPALSASLIVLWLMTPCAADSISFQLSSEFSGAQQPEGYLIATFDDGGTPGSVTLTVDATNLVGTEYAKSLHLNLDPSLDPVALDFSVVSRTGSFADPSWSTGVNGFMTAGSSRYDVLFTFANSNAGSARFGSGDVVRIAISGIEGLTASSFNSVVRGGRPSELLRPTSAGVACPTLEFLQPHHHFSLFT